MSHSSSFVVCLSNQGYEVSLVIRRIYETLPDPDAGARGMLRVIDESGDDYLFPSELFEEIEIPTGLREKLALGS